MFDLATEGVGEAENVRFGVIHVDADEVAEVIRRALLDRVRRARDLVSPATPVIATHIGRNAWSLACVVESG